MRWERVKASARDYGSSLLMLFAVTGPVVAFCYFAWQLVFHFLGVDMLKGTP